MNVVREIQRLNERELELHVPDHASWHAQYSHSAYIFVAGLDYQLTEGDVICIFSQSHPSALPHPDRCPRPLAPPSHHPSSSLCPCACVGRFGEVVDCHLVRDKDSGKSRGFAFLAYEDQRSSVLAIDNLNGAAVVNRTLRVDHADKYRRPKEADPSSTDAEYQQFEGEQGDGYDERRRRIWDYEMYAPVRPVQGGGGGGVGVGGGVRGREGGGVGSAPLSYSVDVKGLHVAESSEDANALRILRMWEERQQRKREREDEERRRELQAQRGGRGRDGGRRFGDQEVQGWVDREEEERKQPQPLKAEAAVERPPQRLLEPGGKREREEEVKESRIRGHRRHGSRERSPRSSRSRSRERSRAHRRRERSRDRDVHRDQGRRSRERDSSDDTDRRRREEGRGAGGGGEGRHRRRDRDTRSRSR